MRPRTSGSMHRAAGLRTAGFVILLVLMPAHPGASGQDRWTLHPIHVSDDAYTEADIPVSVKQILGLPETGFWRFRKEKSGFYLTNGDTLLPIVTERDTIPGFSGVFGRFKGPRYGYYRANDSTVAFLHEYAGKLLFCSASRGRPARVWSFPDTVVLGTQAILPDRVDDLGDWFFEDRDGSPFLYVRYKDISQRLIGIKVTSALFSYDGRDARKILARDDEFAEPEKLLVCSVGGGFFGPQVVHDATRDRWMVQAVVQTWNARAAAWNPAEYAVLLIDKGSASPVFVAGDSIANVPGAVFGSVNAASHIWWKPDLERGRAFLFADYRTGDGRKSEGFFVSSSRKTERYADWSTGDPVPGSGGGRLNSFQRTEQQGNLMFFHAPHAILPDERRIISYASLKGSKSGKKEGILRYDDGTVTILAARNDTVSAGGSAVFTQFFDVDYSPVTGEVFFTARTSESEIGVGLFSVAGGRFSTVVAVDAGVLDERDLKRKRSIMFTGVTGFTVLSDRAVAFTASHYGGSGYYVAVRD